MPFDRGERPSRFPQRVVRAVLCLLLRLGIRLGTRPGQQRRRSTRVLQLVPHRVQVCQVPDNVDTGPWSGSGRCTHCVRLLHREKEVLSVDQKDDEVPTVG